MTTPLGISVSSVTVLFEPTPLPARFGVVEVNRADTNDAALADCRVLDDRIMAHGRTSLPPLPVEILALDVVDFMELIKMAALYTLAMLLCTIQIDIFALAF